MVDAGANAVGAQQVNEAASFGSAKADGGNAWSNYFGPASSEIKTNAYDKYAYETYDLPEAYKGRNLFLRDTIDGFILGDNEWFTTVALPYAQTNDIHLAWNEWHFNQTLAGRVPHEGVSRLITSSKRQFKDHTVRRGLAFILEHGFMNTAEGREQYRRNLLGIKQCVQETANHDVISAFLHARDYDKEWERRHGLMNRPVKQIMRREVNEFAIVQKDISGLEILHEEYKKRLSRYGVTPTLWIFPPKMSIYATMVPPEKTQYQVAGPDGAATFKAGPKALGSFRGINVHETRLFDVYENELPIDLLRRRVQIGEYYTMGDPHRYGSGKAGVYQSNHRDIILYDESIDNWRRISFADAVLNCTQLQESGIKKGDGGTATTVADMIGAEFAGNKMVELSYPSFMNDRMGSGVVSKHFFDSVQASVGGEKFVTKDGRTGVYATAVSASGKLGKASAGDAQALFADNVHTEKDWKGLNVKKVLSEMKASEPTWAKLVAACQTIVDENHAPDVSRVTKKKRNVSSVRDYGTKRAKTSEELLENILENRFQERGVTQEDVDHELAYAQSILQTAAVGAAADFDPDGTGNKMPVASLPLSKSELMKRIRGDLPVALDVLLVRPFMEYETSSAVLTKGGYDTGATFVGHSDFVLGDDVVSKLHYGNFTFYSKAVVTNPRNVIIARNIFCQGYVGGNDCKWLTATTYNAEDGHKGSLMSILLPAGETRDLPNPLDITGDFNGGGDGSAKAHYSQAASYRKTFNLSEHQRDVGEPDVFLERQVHQNTICYRGHQFSFDVNTGHHSAVTVNTGHWGPDVYPGCGRVRAGEMKYLEKKNYTPAVM